MHEVSLLVDAIRQCADRRGAGLALLGALVPIVEEALRRSRYEGRARVVRASLHGREAGAYQDLIMLDTGGLPMEPLTSATAWRLLELARAALVLDVESQRWGPLATPLVPSSAAVIRWEGATRTRLQGRSATHVAVLPLRGSSTDVVGMVALEIDCPAATGRRFDPLASCAEDLQLRVNLCAGLLRSLPGGGPAAATDPLLPVIGRAMAGVVEILRVFTRFDETILLRGETGTGKSHLARWCHAQSPRSHGPFVVAQPHTLAENLREADLFGWKKGAFTGAVGDHVGRVARAEGGTLFLDEIDKLDLSAQGKLLRLLDERVYSPLGDDRDRVADVRFIIGSNIDLERAVAEGRFLEDLYYRAAVLPVEVPPLRARTDEIGPWVAMMSQSQRQSGPAPTLSPEALCALCALPWPGNLRQLHSAVVRAMAFAELRGGRGSIELEDVIRATRQGAPEAERNGGLIAGLRATAAAFLRASERRVARGAPPLTESDAEALWGAVLLEAVRNYGGSREAFTQLGLEARLHGGNHLRTLRRERERLAALCEAVGATVPDDWRAEDSASPMEAIPSPKEAPAGSGRR